MTPDESGGSDADPFAALREMDEEVVAEARERDDEWGAMVRVCHDLARDVRPAREDCEMLGLPYSESDDEYKNIAASGPLNLGSVEPTRAQVRSMAGSVVVVLRRQAAIRQEEEV